MTMFLGSILATALVVQAEGSNLPGKIVDDQGKPVEGTQVIFFIPRPWIGNGETVELETKTNAQGEFHLILSRLQRAAPFRLWAYRPGWAVATIESRSSQFSVVLHRAQPRTVKVEGPDGHPIAGARLSPLFLDNAGRRTRDELPRTLANQLAVTTGSDGQATLNYLAFGVKLVTVRLTTATIGTQDLQLLRNPARENQGATVDVRLGATKRLAGRVRNRSGQPVAGQEVEVWSGSSDWLRTEPLVFQNGPVRTAADGSFQTPESLLVGSVYMAVVRTPGFETVFSKYVKIGDQMPPLLPLLQRPLRTIRGRVTDRQGTPLAGVEVFQSGDGPVRTTTRTQADGRFILGGFRDGSVFLFARREGFRFFGRLTQAGEEEVAVQMIRIGEFPAPALRTLPEPIPRDEALSLTRRLIQPCWDAAVAQKDQEAAFDVLTTLAPADPVDVLQKLETEDVVNPARVPTIKRLVARALVRKDPSGAEKLAESLDSPMTRGAALWDIAAALPEDARDRKLALFERAALEAKAGKSPLSVATAAHSLYDLGEKKKARALVAENVDASKVAPERRTLLGYELARVEPAVALSIARELAANYRQDANGILWNVAIGLAEDNPTEAERVLRMVPQAEGQSWMHPALAWKLARSDPARARRLVDESQHYEDSPQTYLYLACGLKGHDPAAADVAFWKGISEIDRQLEKGVRSFGIGIERSQTFLIQVKGSLAVFLPLVEHIDPTLVPEIFWRALAARPPVDTPLWLDPPSLGRLAELLAWYDRGAAATLLESDRLVREQTGVPLMSLRLSEFRGRVLWDPRAVVADIEQLNAANDAEARVILTLRRLVGTTLSRSYEDQWHLVWRLYGYGQLKDPLVSSVW